MCSVDEAVRAGVLLVAQNAGLVARVGTVVSSGTVVWQAEEKRRLQRLTDATGLDMESAALAGWRRNEACRWRSYGQCLIWRMRDLPLDFNLFLRPTGWAKGMQALIRSPPASRD